MGFLYEFKTITQDFERRIYVILFFVSFVIALEKFSGKKLATITKECRKIRTNFKKIFVCTLDHNRR
jgi:hypothetical protein